MNMIWVWRKNLKSYVNNYMNKLQEKATNKIAAAVASKGAKPVTTAEAIEWLKFHVREAGRVKNSQKSFKQVSRSAEGIGRMYFFQYDPKHKKTLPYYDMFPLVIPIEQYDDGFLGLNLHYLPPMARARLLDNLMNLTRQSGSDKAYMQLSYDMLEKVAKVKGYDACIKRYLTAHIRSSLIKVSEEYWEEAALLPVQEFRGSGTRAIWGSRK